MCVWPPPSVASTGRWGSDPQLVVEGDVYIVSAEDRRSKFELYHPDHALIRSLVHDHLNAFPTWESYAAPFRRLVDAVPPDGLLVCAHQYEALRRITEGRQVVWYGLEPCERARRQPPHAGLRPVARVLQGLLGGPPIEVLGRLDAHGSLR